MTYHIMGKYEHGEIEELDTTDSRKDAEYLLGEYRTAFGQGWDIWIEQPYGEIQEDKPERPLF